MLPWEVSGDYCKAYGGTTLGRHRGKVDIYGQCNNTTNVSTLLQLVAVLGWQVVFAADVWRSRSIRLQLSPALRESGASTMGKTVVINGTDGELFLKEGNAGVFRDIKKLPPYAKYIIEIDPNATYREYVVVSSSSGKKVYVTSDDCIDNSTITIHVENGVHKFIGTARGETTSAEDKAPASSISKLFSKIWSLKK